MFLFDPFFSLEFNAKFAIIAISHFNKLMLAKMDHFYLKN